MTSMKPKKTKTEVLEAALAKLAKLELHESKKEKIQAVMRTSSYSNLYCNYFLADNPAVFRDNLTENKEFTRQAGKAHINLGVVEHGVPDEGLTLPLDSKKRESNYHLVGYANFFFKLVGNLYSTVKRRILEGDDLFEDSDAAESAADRWAARHESGNLDDRILTQSDIHERQARFKTQYTAAMSRVKKVYKTYRAQRALDLSDITAEPNAENLKKFAETLNKTAKSIGRIVTDLFPQNIYDSGPVDPEVDDDKLYRQLRSLDNVVWHLSNYRPPITSSKVKSVQQARYFIQKETLNPPDVTFGNNAGCCLGVYDVDDLGNADALPVYQLHKAISIFGIYQQIGDRKAIRVGLILGFHSLSDEGSTAFLVNSVELSDTMNPLRKEQVGELMDHVRKYLWKYCDAANINDLAMSTHEYNTGYNHMKDIKIFPSDDDTPSLTLMPTTKPAPQFYSDVLWSGVAEPQMFCFLER
jgi:hypothetical protein